MQRKYNVASLILCNNFDIVTYINRNANTNVLLVLYINVSCFVKTSSYDKRASLFRHIVSFISPSLCPIHWSKSSTDKNDKSHIHGKTSFGLRGPFTQKCKNLCFVSQDNGTSLENNVWKFHAPTVVEGVSIASLVTLYRRV